MGDAELTAVRLDDVNKLRDVAVPVVPLTHLSTVPVAPFTYVGIVVRALAAEAYRKERREVARRGAGCGGCGSAKQRGRAGGGPFCGTQSCCRRGGYPSGHSAPRGQACPRPLRSCASSAACARSFGSWPSRAGRSPSLDGTRGRRRPICVKLQGMLHCLANMLGCVTACWAEAQGRHRPICVIHCIWHRIASLLLPGSLALTRPHTCMRAHACAHKHTPAPPLPFPSLPFPSLPFSSAFPCSATATICP